MTFEVNDISIQVNSSFPVELLNEETQKWEIIHSVQFNDTIYCSEELYNRLKCVDFKKELKE